MLCPVIVLLRPEEALCYTLDKIPNAEVFKFIISAIISAIRHILICECLRLCSKLTLAKNLQIRVTCLTGFDEIWENYVI